MSVTQPNNRKKYLIRGAILLGFLILLCAFLFIRSLRAEYVNGMTTLSLKSPVKYIFAERLLYNSYKTALVSSGADVTVRGTEIYFRGKAIEFPTGRNLVVVSRNGDFCFIEVPDDCFVRTYPEEVRKQWPAIFGFRIPSFRSVDGYRTGLDLTRLKERNIWSSQILPHLELSD
jgi:hypothetical protein